MLQLMYDLFVRHFHDCQFQVEIAVNSFPEASAGMGCAGVQL